MTTLSDNEKKTMQTIELTTTIEADGSIRLPEDYKTLFGKHARLVFLVAEETNKPTQTLSEQQHTMKVLEEAWGAWGNKTLDEVDKEIAEMRDADWERETTP